MKQYGELPEHVRINDTDVVLEGEDKENAGALLGLWVVACSQHCAVARPDGRFAAPVLRGALLLRQVHRVGCMHGAWRLCSRAGCAGHKRDVVARVVTVVQAEGRTLTL